uniref:protein-tyrosine-phosphatase n=1 Tax=Aceria tosichella TaxID=561515 RepID=A0A6G1SL08_9ACAR
MKSHFKHQLGIHLDAPPLLLCASFILLLTTFSGLALVSVEAFYLQLPNDFPPATDGSSLGASSKPVRILTHPTNVTALEKKTAILICEAESDPKPTYYWFKDGVQVNKKRTPIIKYNKGTVLRIEPLKIDRDSGAYECLVENGVGSAVRSHIQVRVINETDAPNGFPRIITQPVATQTVEAGGVATISCQASGEPAPEYAWLHESIPLDIADQNGRIVPDNGTLKIHNVTEADKGGYLCIATNRLGTITSITSNLMVSLEPLPDGAPTDLKFKLTSPNDVTITWSPPETKNNVIITGYQVYFGKLGAATSNKQDIPNILKMAFSDLSDNTEYAFRVRAKSKGGFGAFSNTINFTTPKDSPPPPNNVKAMANSYHSAMVWWDETAYFSGITGYRVYYSIHNQTNPTGLIMNEDLDRWQTKNVTLTNSVIITNLVENSHYDVRVCAVGLSLSGKLSNSVRFRTLPEEVPYDLKTSDLTTHSVKISWKQPLELVPSKYKITYDAPEKHFLDSKNMRQQLSIPMNTLYTTATQITLQDLRPYTKYRINVTAVPSKEAFRPPVTVHITTAMAAPKSMDEPTLIGPTASGREYELYLPLATEEYGPIGYYYVVVLPADMPSQHPDIYLTSELKSKGSINNGPYIAAKFPKSKMVTKFTLGDNKSYDGFLNRPLNKDQTYHVFVRAEVEHSESLSTSSPVSAPITLQPRTEPRAIESQNETFKKVRVILLCALVLVIFLAVIVTVFYKTQRQALKTNQINETTIRLLPDHMMDRIYSSVPIEPIDRKNMNYQSRAMQNHPPVPINDLAEHIEFLKLNNNLKEEYESIEPGQQFTWENSYLECNRSKNRYGNVVAYDHSRVILTPIDGIPGSDYINANFCDGYQKPNHYIATQGPLPNTVGDFWRMVWEQNSRTIVMMTQLEERGRVKCVQYWPSRDSVTYHGITIIACSVEELAYYSIRTFKLQYNNELREIRQFQFTAWPDHGVPDHPTSFLMFLRRTKVSNPPEAGPMVVLCSAGVGRTGCFIVIDSMIERLKKENTIDIYGHVTSLRAQRNYIVQTEDQYMFIHDAVLEAAISANTEVPVSNLSEHFNRLMQVVPNEGASGLELEFKRLASIKHGGQKFISANLPVNKHKNRLMNILPYESTRVCLEPIAGVDGSDYINASFCDGYRLRNAYIATQSPLPETVEDMWRMLYEHNSGIIVMLTKLKEMGREKCTQYWPAERFGDYGPFRIALNQEYDTNTFNYILREFTITDSRNPGYNRIIRQFHYTNWPEQGLPKSGESFINFIAEVHKTKQKFGIEGPITVHCSVGVGRTGVFIALSIILERLQNEGFLNLFETVRTLRTQRPGMVQTEDQYQFCYQTALEYVRSFEQ